MAREAAGTKKQRDQLRATMGDHGCTREQIAAEMARRFGFRARQAWRHTHGWTQDEVAAAYNRLLDHDQAPMTGKRISDFEAWPHGGVKPTTNTLAMLATLYCTTPAKLVDLDDRQAFSTQELIALDTHTPLPAHLLHPGNNTTTTHVTAMGEHATPPNPDTPTTTGQPDHAPQVKTAHRLTVYTQVPSPHHRWHLILISLLVIIVTIDGVIITRTIAAGLQSTMPAHTSPSAPFIPTTSSPPSTPPPSPPLPSQTVPSPHQLLTPSSPPALVTLMPHQPSIPSSPLAQETSQTPARQQTPSSTRPDPLPSPSEPPAPKTLSVSTAVITWKNMYSGLCLNEQEEDVTHDTGALGLRDCNGSTNQMWTEKIIPAHPTSVAKNLVSSRSGKCVTYDPDPDYGILSVWLAPCGKDGQGWIRAWNDRAYIFQAVELPGLCMSAPNDLATEGFIGIRLRRCGPPSPLTDWRPR